MGKRKSSSDTLSLDLTEQKSFDKKINTVKKKIETGEITIKQEKKANKITAEQKRGLIFIAHLPHGFYEDELKNYFKQFGKVTNVKVCRSNKTGRSKGFGYVEFSHPEVAKIAGETMNNYLMFKKRLVVEYVPYEKRPKHLFHGKISTETQYSAKTRRNKQFSDNLGAGDEKYSLRAKKRISRLNKKMKRLNDLGINVEVEQSMDNVQTVKTPVKSETKKPQKQPHKTGIVKKKTVITRATKKTTKLAAINAETVKKIARELIRKKGSSLLTFPRNSKTSKKK